MSDRFAGHSKGVEVVNDGYGNFSERPLTAGELAAREVAAKIQDDIYKHANSAGACYYPIFKLIAEAIDAELSTIRARTVEEVCVWTRTDTHEDDHWETACGQAYILNEGTPAENNMKFCYHCGKTLSAS